MNIVFDHSTRSVSRLMVMLVSSFLAFTALGAAHATQAVVVALGASQTYGMGVSRTEAYPAQLEALLRAKGRDVKVINAGVSGDATAWMLNRLDSSVPQGTKVVILQPGGNDKRLHMGAERNDNVAEITSRLEARHIKVILMENQVFKGMPRGIDGQHLTPEGYHALAMRFLPQVLSALGR